MIIKETKSEGLVREFSVTIPAAEVEEKLSEKIARLKPRLKLSGFRPGKVPSDHIRARFGDRLIEEVVQDLLETKGTEILQERNLHPAAPAQAKALGKAQAILNQNEDLRFDLHVELMPEFDLTDLTKITLERPVVPVDEPAIDGALNELAKTQKRFAEAAAEKPAAAGDLLVIDLIMTVDGKLVRDGRRQGLHIIIGQGGLPPEVEQALANKKAGDNVEAETAFPETYPDKMLAGKKVLFAVAVKAIHPQREPPSHEEMAKEAGCKSVAELRARMKERIEQADAIMQRRTLHAALGEKLAAMHNFPLPEVLVARETAFLTRQHGENKTNRAEAARRVRLQLILAEIGRKNKIEVQPAELRAALEEELRRYPAQAKRLRDFYSTANGMETLRQPLLQSKILDFAISQLTCEDKPVSREQAYGGGGK